MKRVTRQRKNWLSLVLLFSCLKTGHSDEYSQPKAFSTDGDNRFNNNEAVLELKDTFLNERKTNLTNAETERRLKGAVYGNLNCPLEMSMFANFYRGETGLAQAAQRYSESENAPGRVAGAFAKGTMNGRKILFLGDSLTRHLFISLGCLSRRISKAIIPWVPWAAIHPKDIEVGKHSGYNSARAILSGGTELIFHHIPAHMRDNTPFNIPIIDGGWLNSCKAGSQFRVQNPGFIGGGSITLDKDDVVIFNGSVWPWQRVIMFKAFQELMSCMDTATRTGTYNRNWPKILYMVTPATHTLSGSRCGAAKTSQVSHETSVFSRYKSSAAVLGANLPWSSFAGLHNGYGDCTHYSQMGVHDVIAAELVEKIAAPPATKAPTRSPTQSPTAYCDRYNASWKCNPDSKCVWDFDADYCASLHCPSLKLKQCRETYKCTWNSEKKTCKQINCPRYKQAGPCSRDVHCIWSSGKNECRAKTCYKFQDAKSCDDSANCIWDKGINQCSILNCQKHKNAGPCNNQLECVWSSGKKECSILNCNQYKNTQVCSDQHKCYWSAKSRQCTPVDCQKFNNNAKCDEQRKCHLEARKGPCRTILDCQKYNSPAQCNTSDKCFWDSEKNECLTILDCAKYKTPAMCNEKIKCFWNERIEKCSNFNCEGKRLPDCRLHQYCEWNSRAKKCRSSK